MTQGTHLLDLKMCQADGQWNGSVPTCEHEILGACSDEIYFLCM